MAKKFTAKQLSATAFHEAGHAVAYLAFGHRIVSVSISQDPFSAGYCHTDEPRSGEGPDSGDSIDNEAIALCAGPLAERLHRRRGSLARDQGAASDRADLRELADARCGDDTEQRLWTKWIVYRSEAFVNTHWDEIEAVANALISAGTLSGDEIQRIAVAAEDPAWRDEVSDVD